MAAKSEDAWLFLVEYYDPMPRLTKKYLFKYFVDIHHGEMIDIVSKKLFLKKSPCPLEMSPRDFFIGGKLLFYSRELTIVDYGDSKTRNKLSKQTQKSMAILPSESFNSWGNIIDAVTSEYSLIAMQTVNIPPSVSDSIVDLLQESPKMGAVLSENASLIIMVHGERGASGLSELCAELGDRHNCAIITPADSNQFSVLHSDILKNVMQNTTAVLTHCTCCIIKPHAVKRGVSGSVISQIISEGYDISAISTLQFDRTTAEEFLEVYKGVIPDYVDHTVQLCSGISVAIEVRAQEDAVYSFRQLAGPWDIEIAKEIRPDCIRAKCGETRILSGIHCTDLETDGESECEYCFQIMEPVLPTISA